MLKDEGKVLSTMVKQILSSQFPANKNVTNRYDYWMKNRVKILLPRMNECQTFQDFQNIYKSSKLNTGIDDIPLSDDNITQMEKIYGWK